VLKSPEREWGSSTTSSSNLGVVVVERDEPAAADRET